MVVTSMKPPSARQDGQLIRSIFGACPAPVVALAAVIDGVPSVIIASTFTVGVSLDPPMCMFAVQHTSTTWAQLSSAPTIGVSVLSADHGSIVRQLAGRDRAERLRDVATIERATGALLVDGAAVHLECTVAGSHPAGDHDVVLLEITESFADTTRTPLVFHDSRFHRVSALDPAC